MGFACASDTFVRPYAYIVMISFSFRWSAVKEAMGGGRMEEKHRMWLPTENAWLAPSDALDKDFPSRQRRDESVVMVDSITKAPM